MFDNLEIFRTAQAMASHAAQRQALIARNVANADTPGYRARDLVPFSEIHANGDLRRTRPGHVLPGDMEVEAARPGALSPNGNNVSLETEMMMAAEASGAHERALAIYQASLDILRASLGRG